MALTDNIVSYWKTDESSGDAADSVGSNTGVATNVTYTTGKINNGADFNTSTSQLGMGTSSTLNPSAVTFAGWMKYDTKTPAYSHIIGREAGVGTPYCVCLLKSSGKLAMYVYTSGDVSYDGTGSNTLSASTWYHIALTYDATQGLIGYVNGSSDGSAAANGALASYSGTFTMGGATADASRDLDGMCDEWGVWSRALSSSEISSLYNSGSGIQYPFATTNLKLFDGLAYASTKSLNSLAIASVKSKNGLA